MKMNSKYKLMYIATSGSIKRVKELIRRGATKNNVDGLVRTNSTVI